MVAANSLLGVGLYSVHDAALYARLRSQTMSRWVYGNKNGDPVIAPQLSVDSNKTLTFLDFVQALAVRRIRQERRVPLQKIREAYFRAKNEFKVEYPLALDRTRIGLFGPPEDPNAQEIYFCLESSDEDARQYFQLTGKKHGNQLIGQVVATYNKRLIYNDSGLATRYKVFDTSEGEFFMDPEMRFGEPFSQDSGYTAFTLFDAYQSEGSVERAAKVYGVEEKLIELAIEFIDYLQPPSTT